MEPQSTAKPRNRSSRHFFTSYSGPDPKPPRIQSNKESEWHGDSNNWFRSYGNENWEFDERGLTRLRYACINDLPIRESDRKFHWPLGRRPDDHPGLSELGL